MANQNEISSEFVLIYKTYKILPSNLIINVTRLGISSAEEKKEAENKAKEILKENYKNDSNIFEPCLALVIKSL